MPWSYTEDIYILSSNESAIKTSEKLKNRSAAQIRLRKNQLAGKTIEKLKEEEKFIIDHFEKLSVRDIAKCLKLTSNMVSRRINPLKREGKISGEKPKFTTISDEERQEIIEDKLNEKPKKFFLDPMNRSVILKAPPGTLNRRKIQEDLLEVNKEYRIITYRVTKERKIKELDMNMKLIGAYQNHYLFVDKSGRKHSLMKVDFHLGEWEYVNL